MVVCLNEKRSECFTMKTFVRERLGGVRAFRGVSWSQKRGSFLSSAKAICLSCPSSGHRVDRGMPPRCARTRGRAFKGTLAAVRASQPRQPAVESVTDPDRAGRAPPPAGTAPGRPAPGGERARAASDIPNKPSRCSALLSCARSGRFHARYAHERQARPSRCSSNSSTLRREPLRTSLPFADFSHDPLRSGEWSSPYCNRNDSKEARRGMGAAAAS